MSLIPEIPRLPRSATPKIMRATILSIPLTVVLGLNIDVLFWIVFRFPDPMFAIIFGIVGAYMALIIVILPAALQGMCFKITWRFAGFWWLLGYSIFFFLSFSIFFLAFTNNDRPITPEISRLHAHYGIVYGSILAVVFWQLLLEENSSMMAESVRKKSISASRWVTASLLLAWCFIYGLNWAPTTWK